ncbi:MAG: hypothetical protein IPI51_00120 [Betaproteobacteria bacterium]|nr:hypothetical protein [Betaproteobacteria bacterium]
MTGEPTHLQPPQRPPRLPPVASGRRRLWLAGVLANHLLQAALALGAAFAAKTLVDGLDHRQAGAWPGDMLWPAAGVLGLVLAAGALRGLELAQSEALAQHYIAHLRLRLFDRLASLSPEGRQRRSRGGVMLRFVGDAQALRAWVGRGIAQCVAAGCALVALLAGLALWQPRLALWTLPWLVLAGVMMSLTLPPLRRAVRECRRRQAGIATNVYDRIATLPLLQATGATARERRRLQRQNRQLRQAMQRRAWARARHRWAPDLCLAGLAGSLLFAVVTGASAGADCWSVCSACWGCWRAHCAASAGRWKAARKRRWHASACWSSWPNGNGCRCHGTAPNPGRHPNWASSRPPCPGGWRPSPPACRTAGAWPCAGRRAPARARCWHWQRGCVTRRQATSPWAARPCLWSTRRCCGSASAICLAKPRWCAAACGAACNSATPPHRTRRCWPPVRWPAGRKPMPPRWPQRCAMAATT